MGICKQAISQAVSKRDGECNLVYQDITSTASMNSATPLKASTESNAKRVTAAKAALLTTAMSGEAWSSAAREYVVNAQTAAPLITDGVYAALPHLVSADGVSQRRASAATLGPL